MALASVSPTVAGSKPKKLLDQTRDVLRLNTSSKSARPAKDFESCETVSIAESAQCPLVRCPAQLVNHESRKGISEIEGKAVRVAASESGSRTSFNQPRLCKTTTRQARMDTNRKSMCLRLGSSCVSRPRARLALLSAIWLPSRWMKFSEPDLPSAELIASLFRSSHS